MSEPNTEKEGVDKLVQEFARTAQQEKAAGYNIPAQHRAVDRESAIARKLDAIAPGGRTALAVLFDHPDLYVRCCAAVFLRDVMPERALPVLRDIADNHYGSVAVKAGFAVAMWERRDQPTWPKKR